MEDCIFCKIVNGEIPCRKIYEDECCIVFLDISPWSKGHTLVVPKTHFETIFDIDEDILCNVMSVVKKISIHLKKTLNADGIKIVQNNGKSSGQEVFHIHFHVIPSYKENPLNWSNEIEISQEEMDELEKALKLV